MEPTAITGNSIIIFLILATGGFAGISSMAVAYGAVEASGSRSGDLGIPENTLSTPRGEELQQDTSGKQSPTIEPQLKIPSGQEQQQGPVQNKDNLPIFGGNLKGFPNTNTPQNTEGDTVTEGCVEGTGPGTGEECFPCLDHSDGRDDGCVSTSGPIVDETDDDDTPTTD
jgi:hypothetical protein